MENKNQPEFPMVNSEGYPGVLEGIILTDKPCTIGLTKREYSQKKQRNRIYRNAYINNFNRAEYNIGSPPFYMGICYELSWQPSSITISNFPEFALFKPDNLSTACWWLGEDKLNERFTCLAFCIAMTD